jgi:inhibitor of cysteine peptidase
MEIMMIMMKRISFLLVVTLLLTSCSALSSTPIPTATLPPTAETPNTLPEPTDPTQLITVKAGETFKLVLPSNSSTGYRWNIVPELDETIVQFVEQSYIAEQPVMPGSGGVDVWTFRAGSAGDTTIVLGYYPPGNETDPDEVVTFSIHIE